MEYYSAIRSEVTQEETDNLNRLLSIKEIESIINNLLKQKMPSPNEFTVKLDQTFKEEIIPILYREFLS